MRQSQHRAYTAAAALLTIFYVTGNFMHAGIQLDTMRRQNHNTVGRNLHLMLQHQLVADLDEGLLNFISWNIK